MRYEVMKMLMFVISITIAGFMCFLFVDCFLKNLNWMCDEIRNHGDWKKPAALAAVEILGLIVGMFMFYMTTRI